MFSYLTSFKKRYSLEETSMASHLQGMTLTYPKKRAGWYTLGPPLNLCATLPKRLFISTVFLSNTFCIVTHFGHTTNIIISKIHVLTCCSLTIFSNSLQGTLGSDTPCLVTSQLMTKHSYNLNSQWLVLPTVNATVRFVHIYIS